MLRKILIGLAIAAGVGVLSVRRLPGGGAAGSAQPRRSAGLQPPVTSRVHAGDGALVAEFAREQRVFVPIAQIPDHVKNAFISTEDSHFFEHSGIDYRGLARAMVSNVGNVLRGRRLEGASTITQQVAGNMLTGRAAACEGGVTGLFCAVYTKLREGLMAQRIERAFGQGSHPRTLSEPDLSRQPRLWRRRRRAQLFRQVAWRTDHRRGRLSGRAAEGARQLRPRAQPRSRR